MQFITPLHGDDDDDDNDDDEENNDDNDDDAEWNSPHRVFHVTKKVFTHFFSPRLKVDLLWLGQY